MASLLETDLPAALILLVVGVVAIILALFLLKEYMATKKIYHLTWAISFLVLFVSGVLIILMGFAVLEEDLVPVVAALIPVCLAIGLFNTVWPDKQYWLFFTIYTVLGLIILTVARLDLFLGEMKTMVLMAVHVPSGLSIVLIPLYTGFITKDTEWTSVFFSIGGLLISFGGVLLAFLKLDMPILSQQEIFAILPILLLIVGVFFVLGIGLPTKWKVKLPFLD
ncbi:MAG: hypothetical protein ACW98X_27445 [Promethearchaeota archaeon]|jgi:hypothetical protein